MTREIYQMTGFAITFSPSWSVAVKMRCKATGQGYVVTKALPKMSKLQAFIAFVRVGSELVRLGNAENVRAGNGELPKPGKICVGLCMLGGKLVARLAGVNRLMIFGLGRKRLEIIHSKNACAGVKFASKNERSKV